MPPLSTAVERKKQRMICAIKQGARAAQILRQVRGDRTQGEFCILLREQFSEPGVCPSALSHFESGRRAPLPSHLRMVLTAGVPLGEEDMMALLEGLALRGDQTGDLYLTLTRSWLPSLSQGDRIRSFWAWLGN